MGVGLRGEAFVPALTFWPHTITVRMVKVQWLLTLHAPVAQWGEIFKNTQESDTDLVTHTHAPTHLELIQDFESLSSLIMYTQARSSYMHVVIRCAL